MDDQSIAEIVSSLPQDPWRQEVGFSQDMDPINEILLNPLSTETQLEQTLNSWLQKHQPCLFGKIAARLGLLCYCVLTPVDLCQSDEFILNKIQNKRRLWTRHGFEGKASGFLVVALAKQIANALPEATTLRLAQRLASLYLLRDIEADTVYHDELFLEIPSRSRTTWRWLCGVNYFSSQGDKRWWHDHRIPGGMAFSVNSVGHMIKSGKLANALADLQDAFDIGDEQDTRKLDTREKALELAMRTISLAADTLSGKATELLSIAEAPCPDIPCPIQLPAPLADKSYCEYKGYYHTDFTLPSEYFSPAVTRPSQIQEHRLDFTYLFDRRITNLDFMTMGEGGLIRAVTPEDQEGIPSSYTEESKIRRALPQEITIAASRRLREAIKMK